MAAVNVSYKGNTIAELDGSGAKTIKTGGCYCEGDISVQYAPRSRIYEITLAKASGWVLLTALDEDVLQHINDPTMIVTLRCIDVYEYVFYTGTFYSAGNNQIGTHSAGPIYGIANRKTSETATQSGSIFRPANNTGRTDGPSGEMGAFAVDGGKYYVQPGDGFVAAGNWRLAFNW